MMTFDLVLVSSLIYASLVVGSLYKFKSTGITGKTLLWTPVLPIFLMLAHLIMFIHSVFRGKITAAFVQLVFPVIKYPLTVIFFAEIIMEHAAMVRSAEKYREVEELKKTRTSRFDKTKFAIRNFRDVVNGFEKRERGLVRKLA